MALFHSSTCFLRSRFPRICIRFLSVISRSPSTILMDLVNSTANLAALGQDKIAIRGGGNSHSYSQLLASTLQISKCLRESTYRQTDSSENVTTGSGCLNGARVGLVAKPSAEFVSGLLATWLSGGVAVPLALSHPEPELFHVMNDSDITVLLSPLDQQSIMKNVAAKFSAKFMLIPPVPSMSPNTNMDNGPEEFDPLSNLWEQIKRANGSEGDDPALIVYTSGTTGKPKGVVHTHNGIKAQVQMLSESWEYTSSDQFLHCLPLHHVHGLFNALLAPLYAGSVVEFMPKFTVRGIWQR